MIANIANRAIAVGIGEIELRMTTNRRRERYTCKFLAAIHVPIKLRPNEMAFKCWPLG